MTVLKDPDTWWTIFCFIVGVGVGYSLDVLVRRATSHRADVELFVTTTPDAYPPGREHIPSVDQRYVVTRHESLGSFTDIHGRRHQQWRVYGRPA